MIPRASVILVVSVLTTAMCSAAELASHAELVRILRTEQFKLIRHVREISERDWMAAGVWPRGRSITASMVDPGRAYQNQDFGVGDMAERQLFLGATNPRHEILCFWEATHGGPVMRVLILQRDSPRPKLIFYGMMNNDIPHERWTWGEVKRHIVQNKMDPLMSAEHPGVYDNRLP